MDTVTVGPALTPEEWATLEASREEYGCRNWIGILAGNERLSVDESYGPDPENPDGRDSARVCGPARHAVAAFALHGQPFGPKREYVEALREAIAHSEGHEVLLPVVDDDGLGEYRTNPTLTNLRAALAFIESLLPPE